MQEYINSIVTGDVGVAHKQDGVGSVTLEDITGGKDINIEVSETVAKGATVSVKKIIAIDGSVSIEIGDVSAKQFDEFIAVMEQFIGPKQVKKLGITKKKRIRAVIENAKRTGGSSGIKTVVEYLADVSSIVLNFLTLFPMVSPWIVKLFT